jgi:hypothetical protein
VRTARAACARLAALAAGVTLVAAGGAQAAAPTVFASGLTNPRGLAFGPDGALYAAEGGTGGGQSTVGTCDQVVAPIGPYSGGLTAKIERFTLDGARSTVAQGLPSSSVNPSFGALSSGVADVAFLDGRLYALIAGGGCSHGLVDHPNAILRINADGTTTQIADLSAFVLSHPVAHPEPDDFEPDGTWYSMAVSGGAFYAVEPNHGEVDRITPDGAITRVIDVSAKLGHVVPTAIDAWNGRFFLGNLGTFPIAPGSEKLWKLTAGGRLQVVATGLSTVLSVVVDRHGRIYVLESMTMPGFPGPDQLGSGSVLRVKPDGTTVPVATGLSFPTDLALGPDGALFVSNLGFGGGPGAGQIVKIPLG